jgi:hypothetical protein
MLLNELFDKPVSKRMDELEGEYVMLPKVCVKKKGVRGEVWKLYNTTSRELS